MKQTSTLFAAISLVFSSVMPVYANGLNEYEHIAADVRLTMNKYRALQYILPDEIHQQAMDKTQSIIGSTMGGGINIGTILPGANAPRELNIFINGDVVQFAR